MVVGSFPTSVMFNPYSHVSAASHIPNYDFLLDDQDESFELSDYLMIGDGSGEDLTSNIDGPVPPPVENVENSRRMKESTPRTSKMNCGSELKKIKRDIGSKVAFRTKSTVEILDDGYKWRKYGKKSVKNSPNKRNYYHCSNERCPVKKRIERDREDSSYVITTYVGVHNHETPFGAYFTHRRTIDMASSSYDMPSMLQIA